MREAVKIKTFPRLIVNLALILAVLASGTVTAATQYPYGNAKYGQCSYGFGCGKNQVVTMPTGLQVAINLENGQTIPRSGYTVVATPLNGQGKTFDHVEFWLDGVLVATVKPSSNGTVEWFWDPVKFPGTKLTAIVFDTDGSKTTQEFDLKIGDAVVVPGTGTTGDGNNNGNVAEQPSSANPVVRVFQQIAQAVGDTYSAFVEKAQEVFRALPKPVVFAFPYFLLLLILINILLLLAQAHRELSEFRVLQAIVARGRAVNDAKKTLAQLVSHYLRTPLTLLMGGVDLLKQDTAVQEAVKEFEGITSRLHLKVEALINETIQVAENKSEAIATQEKRSSVWKQRGLFLPIIVIPLILIPYNYIATTAGTYSQAQINIVAQIILFGLLITALYTVLRQRQLRLRNAAELRQVIEAEEAINLSRDNLIAHTAEYLSEDLSQIDALLAGLESNSSAEFIRTGQTRFQEMLSKLRVATRIKGLHSQASLTDVTLDDLFAKALAQEQGKATEKQVVIRSNGNVNLRVQSPDLVAFVLQSFIDNAIAYSDEKSTVDVSAAINKGEAIISVTDHGSGIPEESLPTLFQPFNKAEGAEVFTHEGMGFSLYLDKLIADYVGAKIEASSEPGKATVFSLRLANQNVQ